MSGPALIQLILAALALASTFAAAETGSAAETAVSEVRKLVTQMSRAGEGVRDYSCTFTTQEYVDGELQTPSTILMKQRKTPSCVYMKWLKGPYEDREAIFCPGRYDGKLKVREGSGVTRLLGVLSLDPHGSLAMKGNRHPVTESGIFHPMGMIERDFAIADRHPEHNMRVDGVERLTIGAEPSRCWTASHPGGPELGYYAPKTHVCLHETLFLPTLVEAWDATSRLVEHYTWGDYVTNVGLTDADFDVDNPSYGF